MTNNYYEKHKQKSQKEVREIKSKSKKKSVNIIVNVIKIFQRNKKEAGGVYKKLLCNAY